MHQVLVHLFELGGLQIFEGDALLVENLGEGDDEIHPLFDLHPVQSRRLVTGQFDSLFQTSWFVPRKRPEY